MKLDAAFVRRAGTVCSAIAVLIMFLGVGFLVTPEGKAAANGSASSMLRESGSAITKNKLD
jgi:hypothetical protein